MPEPRADQILALDTVSKSYGSALILSEISLDILYGEFVCFLGHTGSGKSTLLKIMAGVIRPDSGSVIYDGHCKTKNTTKNVTKESNTKIIPSIQSRLGMVFQHDALLDFRTLEENVRFPLEIFSELNNNSQFSVDFVLDIVGLKQFKHFYPQELSGGMRQRTAIARALVHNPELIILDQPFDAVDAITRRALLTSLLKIYRNFKKTAVMVTNSIDEAILAATKIIVLPGKPRKKLTIYDLDKLKGESEGDIRENKALRDLRGEIRSELSV